MQDPSLSTASSPAPNWLVLAGQVGGLAKAYPIPATLLAIVGVFVLTLGLVAGVIRPEQMPTVRTRAAARIAHRYGLAVRGSWREWKALFSGIEDALPPPATSTPPPIDVTHDPEASYRTSAVKTCSACGQDLPAKPDPSRVSAPWHEAEPITPREGKS